MRKEEEPENKKQNRKKSNLIRETKQQRTTS